MSVIRNSTVKIERDASLYNDEDTDWEVVALEVKVDIQTRWVRRKDNLTLETFMEKALIGRVEPSVSVQLGDRWTDVSSGATYLVTQEPVRGESRLRFAKVEAELRAV